jgi:hypothetical protein
VAEAGGVEIGAFFPDLVGLPFRCSVVVSELSLLDIFTGMYEACPAYL